MLCHIDVLRVCLVLAFAALLLAPSSAQAQQLDLETVPVDGNFTCFEMLRVELVIDDAVLDLRGFSAVIEYDPLILEPFSVSAGDLTSNQAACAHTFHWLDPGNNDGSWEVDLALLGCSTDGPGSVLTLWFNGLAEGSLVLDAAQSVFRDSANGDIPVTTTAIEVTLGCPVPAPPQSWGTLKAVY